MGLSINDPTPDGLAERPVDTTNDHMVGANGFCVVIAHPPTAPMGRDEALRLAAWLATVADPGGARFTEILTAIRST